MKKINFSAICKRCLRRNGRCIKNEAYIGLCSQNDKQEIIYDRQIKSTK